jgi:hypothetical protein
MSDAIRTLLIALPGVSVRRLTNREGYFTAGRMFALLGERSLLLRLPETRRRELVARARGRPLVDEPVPSPLAWVELPLAGLDRDELTRLAAQSREAVRQLGRSRRSRAVVRRRRRRSPA